MAVDAIEPNSINTARNEPHFVSTLARGKRFLFLDWLFQRIVKPISLSGYLSFIAKFAFLFPFTIIYWLHPRGLPLAVRALFFFGEKQLQKALGDRGTSSCAKETNKLFLGVEGGRGRMEEHFLQFLEFCHSSLCYGFAHFVSHLLTHILLAICLLVFLGHFKYGHLPNRGYFKSSVHTGLSKEEAVFLKL